MSYEKNQLTPEVQPGDGTYRKISGLWLRRDYNGNDEFKYLKSGRINLQGYDNFQAFGEKTILLIIANRYKGKKHWNSPDYFLVAVKDYVDYDVKYPDKK